MPAPGLTTNVELTQVIDVIDDVETIGIKIEMDYQPGVNQYKINRRSADPDDNGLKEFTISQPNPAPAPIAHIGGFGPRVFYIDYGVTEDFEVSYFTWATNTIGASRKRGAYRITPDADNPPLPVSLEDGGTGGSPIPTEPYIADIPIFSDTFDRPDMPYSADGNSQVPIGTPPFNNANWYQGVAPHFLGGDWRVLGKQGYIYQNRFRPAVVARPELLKRVDPKLPVPSGADAKVSVVFSTNQKLGGVFGTKAGLLIRYSPSRGTGVLCTEYDVRLLRTDGTTAIIADQYDPIPEDDAEWKEGDEMAVAAVGEFIKIFKNGYILANIPSSLNRDADDVTYGIYSENHTIRFDFFAIYPLVVPIQEDGNEDPGPGGDETPVPDEDPNGIPYDPTLDPESDSGGDWYVDPDFPEGAVIRWRFIDVWKRGKAPYSYTFHINPNEGGSPQVTKNMNVLYNAGPNRGGIIQEGQSSVPVMNFSGVILTQEHYEAMEYWYDKRIMLEIRDDLGRRFRGVFSGFSPQRIRRPYNPWYHQFQANFTIYGYKNASGQTRYGRF